MHNIKQISKLAQLFMDGASSPAQEQQLYRLMEQSAPGALPPELEALRDMFGWYSKLPAAANKELAKPKRTWASTFRWAAAAAAVMLAAILAVVFTTPPDISDPVYSQYTGSYIVRNGVRTTDITSIYATIVAAEQMADSLNCVADSEYQPDPDYDRIAIEEALSAISDPVLAAQIRNDLLGS